MPFCKNCGAELDDKDVFCASCGAHAASGAPTTHHTTYHQIPPTPITEKEPLDKLFCELAFFGFLFWLPLVAKTKHPHVKLCAKQGLTALIVGTIACIVNQVIQWVLTSPLGWLPFAHIVSSVVFMFFLFFMLFLTWRCVKGALAIHNDQKPEALFPFMNEGGGD